MSPGLFFAQPISKDREYIRDHSNPFMKRQLRRAVLGAKYAGIAVALGSLSLTIAVGTNPRFNFLFNECINFVNREKLPSLDEKLYRHQEIRLFEGQLITFHNGTRARLRAIEGTEGTDPAIKDRRAIFDIFFPNGKTLPMPFDQGSALSLGDGTKIFAKIDIMYVPYSPPSFSNSASDKYILSKDVTLSVFIPRTHSLEDSTVALNEPKENSAHNLAPVHASAPATQQPKVAKAFKPIVFTATEKNFKPFLPVVLQGPQSGNSYLERQSATFTLLEQQDKFGAGTGAVSFERISYRVSFDEGIPVSAVNERTAIEFSGSEWLIYDMDPHAKSVTLAKQSAYGSINAGEDLGSIGAYVVRLADVANIRRGPESVHPAIIEILNWGDRSVVAQAQVFPGEIHAFKLPNGRQTFVKVFETSPAFTFPVRWAEISVASNLLTLKPGQPVQEQEGAFVAGTRWSHERLMGFSVHSARPITLASQTSILLLENFYIKNETYHGVPCPSPGGCVIPKVTLMSGFGLNMPIDFTLHTDEPFTIGHDLTIKLTDFKAKASCDERGLTHGVTDEEVTLSYSGRGMNGKAQLGVGRGALLPDSSSFRLAQIGVSVSCRDDKPIFGPATVGVEFHPSPKKSEFFKAILK